MSPIRRSFFRFLLLLALTGWIAAGYPVFANNVNQPAKTSMLFQALWVNPLELDFGPISSYTGALQIVTVTNTGLSPITGWAGGAVSAPFSASQDCVIPGGLLPGDSCHFYYDFSPTQLNFYSATSNVITNAGSFTIKLQGQGTYPDIFLL